MSPIKASDNLLI